MDMNHSEIKQVAEDLGYELWFHSQAYGTVDGMGFFKLCDDGPDEDDENESKSPRRSRTAIKVAIYPKASAVGVCVLDPDDDEGRGEEDAEPDPQRKYGEVFTSCRKTLFVVPDVTSKSKLRSILASPMEYGRANELCYTRRNSREERWAPPVTLPPGSEWACFTCKTKEEWGGGERGGPAGSPASSLRTCTKCRRALYCSVDCQRAHWKAEHRRVCRPARTRSDSARRWAHVAACSGLTSDPAEVEAVQNVCDEFDRVMFDPAGPPCLCNGRHGCGSLCALSNMLLDIGREYYDVIGFARCDDAIKRLRGEIDSISDYQAQFNPCCNHDEFMDEFGSDVESLREQIVALPDDVRREMIMWQFERIRCDSKIVMITAEEMPLIIEEITYPIHFANIEYSRMVYGADAEQIMCFMHGTFHAVHGEEDYSTVEMQDEEGDDATEATAASDDSADEEN